jgi:hypothetical protein
MCIQPHLIHLTRTMRVVGGNGCKLHNHCLVASIATIFFSSTTTFAYIPRTMHFQGTGAFQGNALIAEPYLHTWVLFPISIGGQDLFKSLRIRVQVRNMHYKCF